MNVLRLSHSDDTLGPIPPGGRSWEIVEEALAEASGEPVTTTIRAIWPTSDLPGRIDRWLDRYSPDIVMLWTSNYWYTYESVPLQLEHRLGRLGRPLATAGIRLGAKPWLNQRPAYGRVRGALLRAVGGRTFFTPEGVIARMEECIRLILHREETALIVRGSMFPMVLAGNEARRQRGEKRRRQVNAALAALCESTHVPFLGGDDGLAFLRNPANFQPDGFHLSASVHASFGAEEAPIAVAAWHDLRR